MSQETDVLAHMKSGRSITPAVAYELYGTLALHSVIARLRLKNHDIRCEIVRTPSGKHVGSYSLVGQMEMAA